MKFSIYALASAALMGLSQATMCVQTSLTGSQDYGAGGEKIFVLYARNEAGDLLPISSPELPLSGTFFYPLSLGKKKAKKSSLPYFQLQSNRVYAYGGEVFSTRKSPALEPVPLYVSSDTDQVEETFDYVNATCDGTTEKVLRFASLLTLPLGSASINGSFAKGTPLLSPILDNALTVPTAVDLIMVDYNGDE